MSSRCLPFVLLVSLLCTTQRTCPAHASEPAEDFLTRLRAAGYFDTAITYLDRIDQYPGVDDSFKQAIGLEKAITYLDAARLSRSATARETHLDDAATSLEKFIAASPHPRQSEARLKLGSLQMYRAAQALGDPGDDVEPTDAERGESRKLYQAASKTFDEIVSSLKAKLLEMQGAKLDPKNDADKITLRDQYRAEYLQGLTLTGQAKYEAAMTFKDPGKQAKKQLEDALATFVDLSEKYDDLPPGAMALNSRGLVQELLGQKEAALDSFIRMMEVPDVEELRDSKFQSASGIVRLSLADKPPKYQIAIDRAKTLADRPRPNERRMPSLLQLQVDLAKAYLAKAKDKKNQKPPEIKRSESESKQLLLAAVKTPGPHVAEAKSVLASLGIESTVGDAEASPLPTAEDPTGIDDAYAKAIELYQAAEELSKSASAASGDEATQLQSRLSEIRSTARQILSRGLAMINLKTDAELVNSARQLLAFILFQDARYREAAVVGSFLAHATPGSEMGMKGGLIARNALQNLLIDDMSNQHLIGEVQELADFTITTWPDHPETPVFQRLIVELQMQDDNWAQAKKLITDMKPSPTRSLLQRKLGMFLYQASKNARNDGKEVVATKYQTDAKSELLAGLESIEGNLADEDATKAALMLTKIHLRDDEIAQASKIMNSEKYGPKKVAERLKITDEAFSSDLYSTELTLLVQKMTQPDSDTDKLIDQASKVMDKLKESITGDDAATQLSAIYLRMARDIREQLNSATPTQKTKLTGAFRVFLERIAKSSDDEATLQWIGQTTVELAEGAMEPGATKATGQAAELLETAVAAFDKLKAKPKEVSPSVAFQLGKANRLRGNYKEALDTFEPLLKEKPNMLNVQMEASLAYEQWAGVLPPKFAGAAYKAALNGARPDDAKKNVMWGWGKISQLTSGNPNFREMFLDARYHVALCRYLWGKSTNEKSLIEKSAGDIKQVATFYPKLGGAGQRNKFDQLLKLIQKDLGENPVGLEVLNVQ